MENRRRSRTNSQSDPIRRGRGRPKTVGLKKQEEEKGEAFNCYRFKDAKHLEYKKGRDPFYLCLIMRLFCFHKVFNNYVNCQFYYL